MRREFLFAILLPVLVGACSSRKTGIAGASCNASADCDDDLQCIQQICLDIAAYPRQEAEAWALLTAVTTLQRQVMMRSQRKSHKVSALKCRAFTDKVVELTVQEQSSDIAKDMARGMIEASVPEMQRDCLSKATKMEISCALQAHSLEELELCEGKQATASRPSQVSCAALADKIIELTVQDQPSESAAIVAASLSPLKPVIINNCISMGTEAEVSCALRAKSLDDLDRCD